MLDLKLCPFCGHEPGWSVGITGWRVYCSNGNCKVAPEVEGLPKQEAITAWNTRHSGWISVDERLPKTGMDIIAYGKCDGETVMEMGFRSEVDTDPNEWADFWFRDTHWMPLPDNPEEE